MKKFQASDKIAQKMTQSGAVVENLATGEIEPISNRESETDFSSQEVAGDATKALDRTANHFSREIGKKENRNIKNTIHESEAVKKRPSSRLQFTEEERGTPELAKAIRKSDLAADKLDRVKTAIPKKKKLSKERTFDDTTGKSRTRLRFEETDKKPNGKLLNSPLSHPVQEAGMVLHSKIHEVEHENSGVEAGHLAERGIERITGYTEQQLKNAYRHHRLKPWRNVQKAEQAAFHANATFRYQKSLYENPQLTHNPLSKMIQKQKIKREYAKELHKTKKNAKSTAASTKNMAGKAKDAAEKLLSFASSHWKGLLIVLTLGLMIMLIAGGVTSCSNMFAGTLNGILGTTYTAEDEDIDGAETDYTSLETGLRNEMNRTESSHPGYDEYLYNLDEIGHDPYELASYLTVLYEDYTRAEVQNALRQLYQKQYTVTYQETVEVRYRTETRTGTHISTDPITGDITEEEYEYEVDVPYNYYILTVTLRNKSIGTIARETLTAEQYERYLTYMETRGGRDGLFPDNPSLSGGINTGEYTDYDIPPEALTNETFRKLITEAEKYLGYPYVWGGSSPSTSFDCSGFVCYVLNHSGVYSMGRTTAEGIRSQCAIIPKNEAKPGDIIFFQGTYNTSGASHVGIYVGNGMMIHCGNPIQYASTESSYWTQHFYCFGRLNYNN